MSVQIDLFEPNRLDRLTELISKLTKCIPTDCMPVPEHPVNYICDGHDSMLLATLQGGKWFRLRMPFRDIGVMIRGEKVYQPNRDLQRLPLVVKRSVAQFGNFNHDSYLRYDAMMNYLKLLAAKHPRCVEMKVI